MKGHFQLLDSAGNPFLVEQDTIALCRCGASGNKPFCDGTHRAIGFTTDVQVQTPSDKAAVA